MPPVKGTKWAKALWSIVKEVFGLADPQIQLESGEKIIAESRSARSKSMFGADTGPLILTDRRLLWRARCIPRIPGDVNVRLSQILSVRQVGRMMDWFLGGPAFKVRLKSGRTIKLYWFEGNDKLREWMDTLRAAIADAEPEA